jgi:hypothetical protein
VPLEHVDVLQNLFKRTATPGSAGVECIEIDMGLDISLCHHSRETSSLRSHRSIDSSQDVVRGMERVRKGL